MESNFLEFEDEISHCLLNRDISYFVNDLCQLLTHKNIKYINNPPYGPKCEAFLEVFKGLPNGDKYTQLRDSAREHNKWIYEFLSVDLQDHDAKSRLHTKWVVSQNILEVMRLAKENALVMNDDFINVLFKENVITLANRDYLSRSLNNNGPETTFLELFNVVSMKDPEWFGIVLYNMARQSTSFFDSISCDLYETFSVTDPLSCDRELCKQYGRRLIEKHLIQYSLENPVTKTDSPDSVSTNDSDLGYVDDNEDNCFSLHGDESDSESIEPAKLKLKKFQLELSELALMGKNVIIYAPTGSGKTLVAVHIANEHLRLNRNGKVAFLVHRVSLVTQQYRAFEKFKNPEIRVVDMRKKNETNSGPMKAHIDQYDVFVMTSDILRNALTLDDGNKMSSIAQLSLIFFDECHNCMKNHPYTKIMYEYFKERQKNPKKKLPQIVGLTASPRSNKKDSLVQCITELCANLDCLDFKMVQNNLEELDQEITQPIQKILKIDNRSHDDFERLLLNAMAVCESEFLKMKDKNCFPWNSRKSIPENRFSPEYCNFVGNLHHLNTKTVDRDDCKQNIFSVYRYLNAYYRGLIVNQMFDEFYSRECIAKYLNHNGKDFLCPIDKLFYTCYIKNHLNTLEVQPSPSKIPRLDSESERDYRRRGNSQANNLSLDKIKSLIQHHLEKTDDPRILIFVREMEYTFYLVDVLEKYYNIKSQAIIGINTKKNITGFSRQKMDEIITSFTNGDIKILVATTVVEEGLDVGHCNMVISYAHVTNETAMIQRAGRARAPGSEYILILPPMFTFLERKEYLNEYRKTMMMNFIKDSKKCNFNSKGFVKTIRDYQQNELLKPQQALKASIPNTESWNFKCKGCQRRICNSEEIRIVQNIHRVCINTTVLTGRHCITKRMFTVTID